MASHLEHKEEVLDPAASATEGTPTEKPQEAKGDVLAETPVSESTIGANGSEPGGTRDERPADAPATEVKAADSRGEQMKLSDARGERPTVSRLKAAASEAKANEPKSQRGKGQRREGLRKACEWKNARQQKW